MPVEGYLTQTTNRHPFALGGVVALHVAAIIAVALMPTVIKRGIETFTSIPIRNYQPEPRPADPKPIPKEQPRTETKPSSPERVTAIDLGPAAATDVWRQVEQPPLIVQPPVPPEAKPVEPKTPVLTGAVPDPRFARDLQPPYPPAMQRLEREGSVVVRVLVGPDGRVQEVVLVRASDEGFTATTRNWALRKWQFKPATRDGVPIAQWREMTVRFEMPR